MIIITKKFAVRNTKKINEDELIKIIIMRVKFEELLLLIFFKFSSFDKVDDNKKY